MKILYIMKRDPDSTLEDIINRHKASHEITLLDIRTEKDYERIVDLIETSDRVITW